MTNKIEISREQLERIEQLLRPSANPPSTCKGSYDEWEDQSRITADELRALLAAPAVERQEPVAYVLTREDEVCYEADDGVVISNTPGDETDLYKWKPVYFELSPAANVPDEHSEFESRIGGKLMGNRHGERLVRDSYGTYRDPKVRTLWMGWQARANLTSPPAPVAVVIDERAEFEKSVIGKAERFHPDLSKYGIDGEYKHAQLQYAWELWQARACLDKVKEMNQ